MAPENVKCFFSIHAATISFNEAGAGWPRKTRAKLKYTRRNFYASMRPGLDGPGKRRMEFIKPSWYDASMRPGLDGPGKLDVPATATKSWSASMRPGLDGPGKQPQGVLTL